ncbi:uncharacterized protein LOC131640748 [Vicia villosa]|uniref:uncharacterized protein LOC131640748 n=1 Tax=Vicia villosa TaxID=3911 RepID=UPI00273AAF4E|nr:uncharacterized protein LOC131640748 [Vicia villosa]
MEEEDVATLTNGETIISLHPIKEEVEIILDTTIVVEETISDSTIVVEEEVTTTKKGRIIVVITVESLDTKQLIADTNISNTFTEEEDIWYLDTGCSNHMCGKKELFSSLNETVKSTVKFGNNSNIPILGKGRIAIRLKDGTQNFIGDVFYAPGLHHNLLSMGQLSEKGYNMQIHNGFCTLIDRNGRFITKVRMTPNRLSPLKIQMKNFLA